MSPEELTTAKSEQRMARRDFAAQAELNAGSLVGSWFHKLDYDVVVEEGLVVAEVQPGIYMLEFHEGSRKIQTLVRLDTILSPDEEFRFYDSDEEMRSAFVDLENAHMKEMR